PIRPVAKRIKNCAHYLVPSLTQSEAFRSARCVMGKGDISDLSAELGPEEAGKRFKRVVDRKMRQQGLNNGVRARIIEEPIVQKERQALPHIVLPKLNRQESQFAAEMGKAIGPLNVSLSGRNC